jgi:hypothetical protein
MKPEKTVLVAMGLSACLLALLGCEQEAGEGPAERAGKELDQAIHKAGETIEELGEEMQEAGDEVQQPPQEQP